jgi:hypothetical protein
MLLMFAQIQRLVVAACQFFLGSEFVANCLVDPCAAAGSFDIRGVQAAHVGLFHCYAILVGVFLGASEHAFFLNF